jgi:hypothetical protein
MTCIIFQSSLFSLSLASERTGCVRVYGWVCGALRSPTLPLLATTASLSCDPISIWNAHLSCAGEAVTKLEAAEN